MTKRIVSIDDAVTRSAVKLGVQVREKQREALLGFCQGMFLYQLDMANP